MKLSKFIFIPICLILLMTSGLFLDHIFAKTAEPAEIYFTKSDAQDPTDKSKEISEGFYGQSFNLIGKNFSKSKDVQIYLDGEYIGNKPVENQEFTAKITVPKKNEEKTYNIKVDGEARGETVEKEIAMKFPAAIPSWVWIVSGLIIIGIGVYFLYKKLFQE